MDSNTILYSSQVDTSNSGKLLDTFSFSHGVDSSSIKSINKKVVESKFIPYNYSYRVSVVPNSDSIFADTVVGKTDEYEKISLDSIFEATIVEPFQTKTLFETHEHQRISLFEKQREIYDFPFWIFGFLFLLLVIISWNFNVNRLRIGQLFMACFERRSFNLLFHDINIVRERIVFALMFSFITILSLFIYGSINILDYDVLGFKPFTNFLFILFATAVFVLLKNVVIRLLGNVFRSETDVYMYLSNTLCYYFLELIVLLPTIFFLFYISTDYSKIVLLILGILLLILGIVRVGRGLSMILLDSKFSNMHLFYYLCIVEIVPILLVIKLVLF